MEKRRSIMVVVALFVFAACLLAVMAGNARRSDGVIDRLYDAATISDVRPARLSQADADYITAELTRRAVGDCVLTVTSYGWRCEDRLGRVYKIARNK